MKIKDYKCKCGHNDFFFAPRGTQMGIYCLYCGKWFKWAINDERNLILKQDPVMEVCPTCGLDVHSDFKFCPRCGSDMRGDNNE